MMTVVLFSIDSFSQVYEVGAYAYMGNHRQDKLYFDATRGCPPIIPKIPNEQESKPLPYLVALRAAPYLSLAYFRIFRAFQSFCSMQDMDAAEQ